MRELLAGLVPGLPDRGLEAIVARAEASRSTRSRRSACWSRRATSTREDGAYVPAGDLAGSRCPRRSRRSSGAPGRARSRATGRCSGCRRARPELHPGGPRRGQRPSTRRSSRACVPWSVASCSRHVADKRSPERGQYPFVQALIREVAYNTLSGRIGRRGTSRRRAFRDARRAGARGRARRPLSAAAHARSHRGGGRRARRAGPDRAEGRRRAGRLTWLAPAGHRLLPAGAERDLRSDGRGCDPRAGRRDRGTRGGVRRGRGAPPQGPRDPLGTRRSPGVGAGQRGPGPDAARRAAKQGVSLRPGAGGEGVCRPRRRSGAAPDPEPACAVVDAGQRGRAGARPDRCGPEGGRDHGRHRAARRYPGDARNLAVQHAALARGRVGPRNRAW